MCESEAAGSRPRTRSRDLALTARAWAAGASPAAAGKASPTQALALGVVPRRCWARRQVVGELVQEQTAQRSLIARVAREQGALDRLGQVDEREHGPVEIGEVRRQSLALGRGEGLDWVVHGAADG